MTTFQFIKWQSCKRFDTNICIVKERRILIVREAWCDPVDGFPLYRWLRLVWESSENSEVGEVKVERERREPRGHLAQAEAGHSHHPVRGGQNFAHCSINFWFNCSWRAKVTFLMKPVDDSSLHGSERPVLVFSSPASACKQESGCNQRIFSAFTS